MDLEIHLTSVLIQTWVIWVIIITLTLTHPDSLTSFRTKITTLIIRNRSLPLGITLQKLRVHKCHPTTWGIAWTHRVYLWVYKNVQPDFHLFFPNFKVLKAIICLTNTMTFTTITIHSAIMANLRAIRTLLWEARDVPHPCCLTSHLREWQVPLLAHLSRGPHLHQVLLGSVHQVL